MARGTTIVDDWVREGFAEGYEEGRIKEARKVAERLLTIRLGVLPPHVAECVRSAGVEWCEGLIVGLALTAPLKESGS